MVEFKKEKIIWDRLKNFKCPLCNSTLEETINSTNLYKNSLYNCSFCEFKIGKLKFNKFVSGGNKFYEDKETELNRNQEFLNNL